MPEVKEEMQRRYVTLTPHVIRDGKRYNINIFSTVGHTKEEIASMVDTDAAVDYAIRGLKSNATSIAHLKENSFLSEVSCDLSYLVDERIRLESSKRCSVLSRDDILCGVHAISIGYDCTDSVGAPFTERKIFMVMLDEFIKKTMEAGADVITDLIPFSVDRLIDCIFENGVDATPSIKISKVYYKSPLEETLISKSI